MARGIFVAMASVLLLAALFLGQASRDAQSQSASAIACTASQKYDASTNGSTKLITGRSDRAVYFCGYTMYAGGTVSVKLVTGTGTNCGTGAADLTPAYPFTAQTGIQDASSFYRGLFADPALDVCLNTSAGVAVKSMVFYAQR